MNDTRETIVHNDIDIPLIWPRFFPGDNVLSPSNGAIHSNIVRNVYWDGEFGGWLVVIGSIGIHECNFISESDIGKWEPHEDGLWSYLTKVGKKND